MTELNGNPTVIGGYAGPFVETMTSSSWTELAPHIKFEFQYRIFAHYSFVEISNTVDA